MASILLGSDLKGFRFLVESYEMGNIKLSWGYLSLQIEFF